MYVVCVCGPTSALGNKTERKEHTLTIENLQFIKLFLTVKHLDIDVDGVTCHNTEICNNIKRKTKPEDIS